MLCPASMQKATKQQGRCKVPPTACYCPAAKPNDRIQMYCSAAPKDE